jgi:archaellum biogenesis ATPase FlaH
MDIKEFTPDIEDLFVRFLYSDAETFVRVKNIVKPAFFEEVENQKVVKLLLDYTDEHTVLPTNDQIKALTGQSIEKIDGVNSEHVDWFMKEFERFCQQKAAKAAVYASLELIEKDRLSEVVDQIKKAAELGIVKDLGVEYFKDPAGRLTEMRDKSNMISTGWKTMDAKLYGGFEKGTLTIFAGQSGAGKSLFLQNLALNWAELGLNVVYLSLELSEKLCAMRLDAMTTGYGTKEILKNIEDVDFKVRQYHTQKAKGSVQVKQLKNGCNANDIRAYIKEYETQSQRKVDAILVDYLDLCMPTDRRVSPTDLFVKDKYVSEELRNIAVDLNVLMVTASQLNRGSHEEIEFDHSHIAGGISKINTADNVLGIFTTISMKESGRYQIQFMKTRSSAGVGSKIDLKFDVRSLRIMDLSEEEADAITSSTSTILASLKKQNILTDKDERPAESGGSKQKAMALRDLVKKSNI